MSVAGAAGEAAAEVAVFGEGDGIAAAADVEGLSEGEGLVLLGTAATGARTAGAELGL